MQNIYAFTVSSYMIQIVISKWLSLPQHALSAIDSWGPAFLFIVTHTFTQINDHKRS